MVSSKAFWNFLASNSSSASQLIWIEEIAPAHVPFFLQVRIKQIIENVLIGRTS